MNKFRRDFLKKATATTLALSSMDVCGKNAFNIDAQSNKRKKVIDWSYGMKPLFCAAYIDPGIDVQKNQEIHVAKFPIALVPQDSRKYFVLWRDKVRSLNPDIKLLAYQMVIEETAVPGPGHDILRSVNNAWVTYPGGYVPKVTFKSAPKKSKYKRIYDPRQEEWQDGFIAACVKTLESYPYDGLFLDQCTVYVKAALNPYTRMEMLSALENTLVRLRHIVGDKILIGNSSYSWNVLNGEMNEGRPDELEKEIITSKMNQEPRIELFQYYMKNTNDDKNVRKMFKLAINNRAFFGASVNPQSINWFSVFDEVLSEYEIV